LVEPSGDAHARGAFGAAKATGHLCERELLGDPELDGSGHTRGKLIERRRQRRADGAQFRELLDASERRVVEGDALDVQSSAGTLVDPLPPQGPVELVARYAEQPREGRRAGIAVAPAAGEAAANVSAVRSAASCASQVRRAK
jgi:hypothetical protein